MRWDGGAGGISLEGPGLLEVVGSSIVAGTDGGDSITLNVSPPIHVGIFCGVVGRGCGDRDCGESMTSNASPLSHVVILDGVVGRGCDGGESMTSNASPLSHAVIFGGVVGRGSCETAIGESCTS